MTHDEIKNNFSKNLIYLRKRNNLTQLQLAEKLNYSDKAISKWEVGSVVPDIETFSNIAEFFGVTVNDLISEIKPKKHAGFFKTHLFMTLLSVGLVWFVSTVLFFILDNTTSLERAWIIFIIALPISSIVLIVFTCLWFKRIWRYVSISIFFWTLLTAIYICISNYNLWFIYIIGVVGQILIVFKWFLPKKKK